MHSFLFGPASRLDFVDKFVAVGADAGILDLEDATAESEKASARQALAAADLTRDDIQLLVRVNGPTTEHFGPDVAAAGSAGADGIVVPMLERPDQVAAARQAMDEAGIGDRLLVGVVESAVGLVDVVPLCRAGLDLVSFGAEDFVTDLGGRRTASNHEVAMARFQIAVAARAAGIGAVDQVVADFTDDDRFVTEAQEAVDLGYVGKFCIHPRQVPLANEAFRPTEEELAWATRVVDAAEAAAAEGRGAVSVDGSMIDAPIVARAYRLLGRDPA